MANNPAFASQDVAVNDEEKANLNNQNCMGPQLGFV